jgi:hypothetical protein
MKVYKWEGSGHYLDATVICIADNMKSATVIIKNKLIDNGLSKSWEESEDIEEIDVRDSRLIYFDNGDY